MAYPMPSGIVTRKDIKPEGPYRIPIEAILTLKDQGLSKSQIATELKCSPSNITKRFQALERVKQYVKNRAFILQHLQRRLLDNLTDGKLKKATAQQLTWAYGVIYDKERLELGESTQIMGYADALKARDTVKITLEEIRRIRIERQFVADPNISPALDTQGIKDVTNVDN